jgi:hypothetical protein
MPILAKLTDLIAHQNSGAIIEPIRKNAYKLYLQVDRVIAVLMGWFPDDKAYLTSMADTLVHGNLPLEISFTPPSMQVQQRMMRGTGNCQVKWGGYATYGDADVTFHNWIDLDTYKFFYRWCVISGSLALKRNDNRLQFGASGNFPIPGIAGDNNDAYKVDGNVSCYHVYDITSSDEIENTNWLLQGDLSDQRFH